jgi:hypothetical protein
MLARLLSVGRLDLAASTFAGYALCKHRKGKGCGDGCEINGRNFWGWRWVRSGNFEMACRGWMSADNGLISEYATIRPGLETGGTVRADSFAYTTGDEDSADTCHAFGARDGAALVRLAECGWVIQANGSRRKSGIFSGDGQAE